MNSTEWKERITELTQRVGTYRTDFEPVIETLSKLMESSDAAYSEYLEKGGQPVVQYDKAGRANPSKNPLLRCYEDLSQTALAYWRDLGLTPAGLKKINEEALRPKKTTALAQVLTELGEEL